MKLAHKRWLRGIAACFCLAGPAWGQSAGTNPGSAPFGSPDQEGAVIISDSAPGPGDPSASVMGLPPGAPPYLASPDQVLGGYDPGYDTGMAPLADGVGYASTQPFDRILWRAGRVNIDQYGINGGYTNINAFIPAYIEDPRALWFFNPRVNITDQGQGATSLGFGRRQYIPELDRVFGASFWWDYDSGHRGTYNQLGGSFESIGRYFSMRGNFTWPIGNSYKDYGTQAAPPQFVGSQIAVNQTVFREQAYQTYEIEAATPFPGLGRYGVDFGLGFYYLAAPDAEDTPGVSLRAQSQVTEDLWINTVLTNDNLFDTQVSVNLELTMPDGRPRRWFKRNPINHYMTESVQRRYRVPVAESVRTNTVIVTGADGNPINIAFIDPNSAVTGTGTLTNPYKSVAEYMSLSPEDRAIYDVIFVRRRNDASDTNLNTTISLVDFQRLIGDGDLPNGQRPTISTTLGDIQLPGTPGALPLLSNSAASGSNVVTLANANEVVGFTIDAGKTASGIVGTNIDSFNIHDVTITNAVDGIAVTSNTTPNLGISNQNLGIINNVTVTGAGFDSNRGITLTHNAGTLNLLVSNNTVTNVRGEDANGNGILSDDEDNNGNGLLDDGVGIEVFGAGGTILATNFTSTTAPRGIINNTVTGNGTGMRLTADSSAIFNVALSGNTVSGSLAENTGLVARAQNGGRLSLSAVVNNTISNNAGDGVFLHAVNGGRVFIPRAEDANGNGLLDPAEDLNNNGLLDPGEDVNGNGTLDPSEDLNNNGTLDIGFFANTISGNSGNGIRLLADAGVVNASIGSFLTDSNVALGNTISNNGRVNTVANRVEYLGSGVLLTTLNGGTINGRVDGNIISGNVEAGIKFAPDAGLAALASISGNQIVNNGFNPNVTIPAGAQTGDAIVFAPSNGGRFSVGQFTGNTIQGNRGAIIRVGGDGGIIDLGVIENTVFDRTTAGTAGIIFDATNATINGVFRNNTFLGSANNANLTFGVGGIIRGGTLNLTFEDNLFDTNAGAGIGIILASSDDRTAPGTGTPLEGDAADARITIIGNRFINTLSGFDPRFDGSAISLQLEGRERNALLGQNDLDQNGIPDAALQPPPDGSDVTNNVFPGPSLIATISENLIGDLTDSSLGNAGAGIDIRASGDSTITSMLIGADAAGKFAGNIIANNGDPATANIGGDGVRVRRTGSAIIDNFTIRGNIIQNNLNDAIDIVGQNNGIPYGIEEILEFEIVGNQLLNNGFLSDGTQGIAGRGVQLRADAGSVLEVDISENLIAGNRMSGIEARTFTDTHILGGPLGRSFQITDPTRQDVESASGGDEGIIFGVWELNEIRGNGFLVNEDLNGNAILDPNEDANGNGVLDVVREGHGIALGRIDFMDPDNPTRIIEGFNNGGIALPDRDGDGNLDLPLLLIQNNIISNNAEDGVHMYFDKDSTPLLGVLADGVYSVAANEVRTSRVDVLNNDIRLNGDDGLNIHNPFTSLAIINFNDNLVMQNGLYSRVNSVNQAGGNTVDIVGDGIEIITANFATLTFSANRNRIDENNGRGVNILTGGNEIDAATAYAILSFDRNSIQANKQEGFYMVNAPLTVEVLNLDVAAGTTFTGYRADTWLPDFDSNHELFSWGFLAPGAGNTPPASIAPFLDIGPSSVPLDAPVTDLVFTNNIVDNNGGTVRDSNNPDQLYSTLGGFVMRVGTATCDFTSIFNFPNPSEISPREVGGVRAQVENNRFSGNFGRDFYLDGFVATEPPNVSFLPDPLVRIDLQFRNNRGGSIDVSGLNFNVFYTNTAPASAGNVKRPNPPFGNAATARDATKNLQLIGANFLVPSTGSSVPTIRIELDGAAQNATGQYLGNNEFNIVYSDFRPFDPFSGQQVGVWEHVAVGTLFPIQANPDVIPFTQLDQIKSVIRTEEDWLNEFNAIMQQYLDSLNP